MERKGSTRARQRKSSVMTGRALRSLQAHQLMPPLYLHLSCPALQWCYCYNLPQD